MMTNEELQAIKDRCEAATSRPWVAINERAYPMVYGPVWECVCRAVDEKGDAEFIAHARIQSATSTRTQVELAAALNIRQSSISEAKRRGEIPASWLLKLLEAYAVSPAWIKTGEGQKYVEYTDAVVVDGTQINWAELDRKIEDILTVARINIALALRAAVTRDIAT